jgi:hypothetical protein
MLGSSHVQPGQRRRVQVFAPRPAMTLFAVRLLISLAGMAALIHALITGEIHIKGGKRITTRSMPNNPILRAQTPGAYWFVWGVLTFIFLILVAFLFALT